MTAGNAIEIAALTKVYRHSDEPAVNIPHLAIKEGEVFGLLGPNGAGKTTTLSILSGLLTPTTGRVSIGGLDLIKEIRQVKQIIGVVTQEIALYPTLTARENLRFFGSLYGLKGKMLQERINLFLKQFGIDK